MSLKNFAGPTGKFFTTARKPFATHEPHSDHHIAISPCPRGNAEQLQDRAPCHRSAEGVQRRGAGTAGPGHRGRHGGPQPRTPRPAEHPGPCSVGEISLLNCHDILKRPPPSQKTRKWKFDTAPKIVEIMESRRSLKSGKPQEHHDRKDKGMISFTMMD